MYGRVSSFVRTALCPPRRTASPSTSGRSNSPAARAAAAEKPHTANATTARRQANAERTVMEILLLARAAYYRAGSISLQARDSGILPPDQYPPNGATAMNKLALLVLLGVAIGLAAP